MGKFRLSYPAFRLPPAVSGSGSLKNLGTQLTPVMGQTVFLVSGQRTVIEALERALLTGGQAPAPEQILIKPQGEPTAESIAFGAEYLRERTPSTIVAIGGGSVLDWARLSWAKSAGVWDIGQSHTVEAAARPRFVLVPTTCASGAEGATVAVYVHQGRKKAVLSPAFLADEVILDGQFVRTLDASTLAASLGDALSHAVESMLSIVPNYLAKMAAGAALRSLIDPSATLDLSTSRADRLMEAAFLAGAAASHTSVGIAHAFAHGMAAEGLSHGAGNAVALAPALLFNAEAPTMGMLEQQASLDVTEIIARVSHVVRPAVVASADRVLATLGNPQHKNDLIRAMLDDVSLRSNPIPVDGSGAERFLELVRERLEAA